MPALSSGPPGAGLATALRVLPVEEGLRFVRAAPGTDALRGFPKGRLMATERFPWQTPG